MGLLEKIFPARREDATRARETFRTLTAYRPAFTTWSGAIYESDLVRAAIDARARHISKLKVETYGSAKPSLQNHMKQGPNQWQTWSQFLYRTSSILDCTTTACLVPIVDEYLQTTGYFPVLPTSCVIVEYEGEPWLRYKFRNGQTAAARMADVAILTKFQFESDFFGDGNEALDETMKLIHIQAEGIQEAVKSTATYRFMASMSNFSKTEDLAEERKRFSRANLTAEAESENGLLLFPNTYKDVKQIDVKPYTVDADQMSLIRANVCQYFGVNQKVMENSAGAEELDAFFNGAVEPFSIMLAQAMEKAMFSERERSQGSGVLVTANRLQYMSTSAKVQMAKELGDRGAILIDEIRELFNFPPLPDGAGQVAPIRGEYKATDELGTEGEDDNADEE